MVLPKVQLVQSQVVGLYLKFVSYFHQIKTKFLFSFFTKSFSIVAEIKSHQNIEEPDIMNKELASTSRPNMSLPFS